MGVGDLEGVGGREEGEGVSGVLPWVVKSVISRSTVEEAEGRSRRA